MTHQAAELEPAAAPSAGARLVRVIAGLWLVLAASPVLGQTTRELVGTYRFLKEIRNSDGEQSNIGATGILVLDADGRYALTIIGSNIPLVASDNRRSATADEARAIVAATIAHFGTYSVNDGNLIFKVERATFPNWNGVEQKRPFKLIGDELQYSVGTSSGSGSSITLTWGRVRN